MTKESDYYVAQKDSTTYAVTKFSEGESEPSANYTVKEDELYDFLCDCPKWMKKKTTFCKHTELVKGWINGGKPTPYCRRM